MKHITLIAVICVTFATAASAAAPATMRVDYCASRFDNRAFRDLAANAPYDVVEIMTNSATYGGGSIFNLCRIQWVLH